jgi:hypothetical protein
MALTANEKALARAAAATQTPRGTGWGSPATGYCPIGSIVHARGGQFFRYDFDPWYHAIPPANDAVNLRCCNGNRLCPADRAQFDTLWAHIEAVRADMLAWTGHTSEGAFIADVLLRGVAALPDK